MRHAALLVAVMALVTLLIRALPFLVFGRRRELPPFLHYLGRVLPGAVMAMLVVYCLRGVSFSTAASWLPQLIACLVTALSYLIKRSSPLSIVCGTLSYMLLLHFVF